MKGAVAVFDALSTALRNCVMKGSLAATLALHGAELPSLVDVPDVPTLLERLQVARPYSSERDALLGDLLRLHARHREGGAFGALLYALHERAIRRFLRLVASPRDRREARSEVILALAESIDAFDPDRRSPNVQANIELDVLNRLWAEYTGRRRARAAEATAGKLAHEIARDLSGVASAVADLLGPREPDAGRVLDDDDVAAAHTLLTELVMRSILWPWDALLLVRAVALGHRIADVANDLGMSHAAARKALERARRRLRARRVRVMAIYLSHFQDGPPSNF